MRHASRRSSATRKRHCDSKVMARDHGCKLELICLNWMNGILDGWHCLEAVDYLSSFIEVAYLASFLLTRYGIPFEIVSHQGPKFTSTQFQSNVNRWGIVLAMSSPGHHQSNGKTEAAVKTVKHVMYKCLWDGTNVYEALLELENIPQQGTGLSPTQLMFGQLTRTRLPAVTNEPVNRNQSATDKNQTSSSHK